MPGIIERSGRSNKRKRAVAEQIPSKRAKSESSEEEDWEEEEEEEEEGEGSDAQTQLLLLENEIVEFQKYEKINVLIRTLNAKGELEDDAVIAAVSLYRVFAKLMASGDLSNKPGEQEETLRKKYSTYKAGLVALLGNPETSSTTLTLCVRLLKIEGENLRQNQNHSFPTDFLTEIIKVLLVSENAGPARKEFSESFVEEFDDIRFYTMKSIEKILGEAQPQVNEASMFENTLEILQDKTVPDSKEEIEDFYVPAPKSSKHDLYSLTKHRSGAQKAWLALMGLQMSKDQRKRLLGIMADTIAPWFTKPELLMDFLTDSYNAGGSTSLLALSGVFYLIQEKNLDYPSFYRKLYSLLDSEILHSKHRSRFFRLLDTFLTSTHLPAVLVASFLKRLSRLTLNAPPTGIVAVVPWIYNIIKKHPTCSFMLHREIRDLDEKASLEKEGLRDPFLMDEEDPMETHAIESSLWEIESLQSHFYPNVATLAKIISEQFTKTSYNIEDFLDHSYGSMLEAEFGKDVKKEPVIEFQIPKKIFTKHEPASGLDNSLLVDTFDFN